jgi:hypothetical protein
MPKMRLHVPIGLPIAAVILLVLGLVAQPAIQSAFSEEVLARNVLLNSIPFIFIFVAIILFYITIIWLVASVLNNNIAERVYRPVEVALIAGIVLGVAGMFQPWWFAGYKLGFLVLLVSTLGFILWSHIVPSGARRQEHPGSVSITEFEQSEFEHG